MIDFNNLIDKYLERDVRYKQVGRYYPSEAGYCLRKSWYSFKYPVKAEPEKLRIFEVGKVLHDFMVDVFQSDKTPVKLLQSEVPIKLEFPDFLISGRIDDLILVLENGELLLVEVKSTTYLPKDAPKPEHVMQLQLYLHSMGVRRGAVLYLEKATLQTKSFPVDYDEKAAMKIIDRFRLLDKDLKGNTLPAPEGKQVPEMNWLCNYCEYRAKCDANEGAPAEAAQKTL